MKEVAADCSNRSSFGRDIRKDHPEGEKVKDKGGKKMKIKTVLVLS